MAHRTVEQISEVHALRKTKLETPSSPKFIVYANKCQEVFGRSPAITLRLESAHPHFHEAGVFLPSVSEDVLFVTSNRFSPPDSVSQEIVISKLTRTGRNDSTWKAIAVPCGDVVMPNGGINHPESGSVLFCAQGDENNAGGLILMDVKPPHSTRPLLHSYHGRWFNSINDVVVAGDGAIWFTDPIYGFEQGFRGRPQLPSHVYRFEPKTGSVRAVAEGFARPNGLCFDPKEQTLYVTDTDYIHGDGTVDESRASHIHAYTVECFHGSPFLTNRRMFAMADTGAPDGIKCDSKGNVYSGCGDGLNIWAPTGELIGKIVIPGGVANFCFGRPGEIFLFNETKFYVANISPDTRGALLEKLGVKVD